MYNPINLAYVHPSVHDILQLDTNVVSFSSKTVCYHDVFVEAPSLDNIIKHRDSICPSSPLFLTLLGSAPDCSLSNFISPVFSGSSVNVRLVELRNDSTFYDILSSSSVPDPWSASEHSFTEASRCLLFLNSFVFSCPSSLLLVITPSLIILTSPPGSSPSNLHPFLSSSAVSQAKLQPLTFFNDLNLVYVNLFSFNNSLSTNFISNLISLTEKLLIYSSVTISANYNNIVSKLQILESKFNEVSSNYTSTLSAKEELESLYIDTVTNYNELADDYNSLQDDYAFAVDSFHSLAMEIHDVDAGHGLNFSSPLGSPLKVRMSISSPPPFMDRSKSLMPVEVPKIKNTPIKMLSKRRHSPYKSPRLE
ncbi:hypothetical protein P9112_006851 [Eukaryota sp. TZLM1-RC]